MGTYFRFLLQPEVLSLILENGTSAHAESWS